VAGGPCDVATLQTFDSSDWQTSRSAAAQAITIRYLATILAGKSAELSGQIRGYLPKLQGKLVAEIGNKDSLRDTVSRLTNGNDLTQMQEKTNAVTEIRLLMGEDSGEIAKSSAEIGRQIAAKADGHHFNVMLSFDKENPGVVVMLNKSGRMLHHCIVITHVAMDSKGLLAKAEQENAVGGPLLGLLGVDPRLAEKSKKAAILNAQLFGMAQYQMLYIDHLDIDAKLQVGICTDPRYLLYAVAADVSVYSSEGSVESKGLDSLDAVKRLLFSPAPRTQTPARSPRGRANRGQN
jgi:hypothetical protein